MLLDFSIAKCKTKATFSAKPRKQIILDLEKIKKMFTVVLETPILLVVKIEGIEVIVHKHGELLFKDSDDVPLMEKITKEVYETGS